jgi:hypothetical protein
MCFYYLSKKQGLVNNPDPTESLLDIQCCGKEYEPLTNSLDPPWVTSPWARQTLNAVWKGSSVLEVHPRPLPLDFSMFMREGRQKKEIVFARLDPLVGLAGGFVCNHGNADSGSLDARGVVAVLFCGRHMCVRQP